MVITKASYTRNYKHLKLKSRSVRIIEILGNSTSSPSTFPFKIVVLMMLFIIFFTVRLVPLLSCGRLMFWRRMIGSIIFNVKMYCDIFRKSSEFSWIIDSNLDLLWYWLTYTLQFRLVLHVECRNWSSLHCYFGS